MAESNVTQSPPLSQESYVKILLDDAEPWNALVRDHPGVLWDLDGVDLTERNLERRDLSKVVGLMTCQVSGSDLSRAVLPPGFSFNLETITEASKNARALFVTMLLGCAYCWLTIGNTKDVELILSTTQSKLPIINVEVPTLGFYWLAPLVLLAFFVYFHLYLNHLWRLIARQPAKYPDGRPVDEVLYPWLMNSLVLRSSRRPEGAEFIKTRRILSTFLGWAVAPITIVAMWFRCLPRHDVALSVFGIIVSGVSVFIELDYFYSMRWLLWKKPRRSICLLVSLCVVFLMIYIHMFTFSLNRRLNGVLDADLRGVKEQGGGNSGHVGFDFDGLNLNYARFYKCSFVDSTWSNVEIRSAWFVGADLRVSRFEKSDLRNATFLRANLQRSAFVYSDQDEVNFRYSDLRGANFRECRMKGVNFDGADLGGSFFSGVDFRGAQLSGLNLRGATLINTDLEGAVLDFADLHGTRFIGSSLLGASLLGANLDFDISVDQLAGACVFPNTILPWDDWLYGRSDEQVSEIVSKVDKLMEGVDITTPSSRELAIHYNPLETLEDWNFLVFEAEDFR